MNLVGSVNRGMWYTVGRRRTGSRLVLSWGGEDDIVAKLGEDVVEVADAFLSPAVIVGLQDTDGAGSSREQSKDVGTHLEVFS